MSNPKRNSALTRVYLDHAAASPLRVEAAEAMREALGSLGANPSSLHAEGRAARLIVEEAREAVASLAGCSPESLVFTSGGTESNRLALEGAVKAMEKGPLSAAATAPRVLASAADHPSVLGCLEDLSARGVCTELLPVDSEGFLRISPGTGRREPGTGNGILLSLLWVNNEIGTIQDAERLIPEAKARGWEVHVDAAQAMGKLQASALKGAGLVSFSSAKIGGPTGIGVLVVNPGAAWKAPWTGGKQEGSRRPGTEAAVLAAGFGAAARKAAEKDGGNKGDSRAHADSVFLEALRRSGQRFRINGPAGKGRAAGILNLSFPTWEADQLCAALDLAGLSASPGAACSSGVIRSSHVLRALGLDEAEARTGVRFSFDGSVSDEALGEAVTRLGSVLASRGRSAGARGRKTRVGLRGPA